MSRRVYANGVLLAEWDDATLTYRRYVDGEVVEERTYTAPEIEAIVGAGAVVINDRQMVVLDDDGSEIFRIGDMEHGDRGLTITRENGTVAFEMRKTFVGSSTQAVFLRDDTGAALISEEPLGDGLSRPFLPIPMLPVTAATTALSTGPWGPQVVVNSGTFTTTHQAWYARHNQYGLFRCRIAASDTTTAGEVQVINVDNGVPLTRFFQPAWLGSRPAGSTGYTEVVPASGLLLPNAMHASTTLAVQVRRTAGAGTLTVAVPESRGWDA